MGKIILITQANDRRGALIASEVSGNETVVYAGMPDRHGANLDKALEMEQYAEATDLDLRPIVLDLATRRHASEVIRKIVDDHGRIDVIVHRSNGKLASKQPAPGNFEEFENELQDAESVRDLLFPTLCHQKYGLLIWIAGDQVVMDAIAAEYAAELEIHGVETTIITPPNVPSRIAALDIAGSPELVGDMSGDIELAEAISRIINLPDGRRPKQIDFEMASLLFE
ncbi:hypothetical protein [Aliirhizobium cellulosilyticum]|uniref:Uncharacterized protein n=1 Tax=Aliirhizobium cellulosilyticum TaxID=393664 RepID=A0A7W6S8W7_9HYPH|nr:hypothetical protein [Rhizobium cellulosilyticum]MBB4349387.1 hypothetical protein [Rhizobium cellulosilyticum]MBB4412391.1 hypothetical protein [Rhizobium cellulosilyticum]MBB4447023.1 hypothetical protein [Rhizobium cellulosilyticum]